MADIHRDHHNDHEHDDHGRNDDHYQQVAAFLPDLPDAHHDPGDPVAANTVFTPLKTLENPRNPCRPPQKPCVQGRYSRFGVCAGLRR